MISGIFHQGSGLGNQLFRYVATRVKAMDLGVGWMMKYQADGSGKTEGFKGRGLFLNNAEAVAWSQGENWPDKQWHEKKVVENGVDIRGYDPEFNFIEDGTTIEGEFQDERYWKHRESEVREWLKTEPLEVPDDLCIINFRGGEFKVFPDLFLPKEYWDEGIQRMKAINPDMRFEVHTDDPETAKQFFPDYKIIQDIGLNWRSVRYAKYAIIANSSFPILPRWLRHGEGEAITIAPRGWARHNIKVWALPSNYYDRFLYI